MTFRRRAQPWFARFVKTIAHHTPLHRVVFYRYEYMFTPGELSFLCSSLDECRDIPGTILEIGCAGGHTTVFLNKHLDVVGPERRYVALDTFAGFTSDDIAVERSRGHATEPYSQLFTAYRKPWVQRTLDNNGVRRVELVQGDVNAVDLRQYAPFAFCLVDVDLYRPVKHSLEQVVPLMSPGGIVVVDDCRDASVYDGAYAAYAEYTRATDRHFDIQLDTLGVIRVPAAG